MTGSATRAPVQQRSTGPAVSPEWHTLSPDEVLKALGASPGGLSDAEVRRRLARYGYNRLAPPERRGPLTRLALQFHNILLYVMVAAAAITAMLGKWLDTAVLLVAVVVNAIIGFVQEGRAEAALDAIRELLSPRALVLRDGRRHEIDAAELVPGDIVLLRQGDRVPADLRLTAVQELRIDESALTGESVPVEKGTEAVPLDAPLGDRRGMAYSGTIVVNGQGTGVVVATGEATELGRVNVMLASVRSVATPLMRQINRFGRYLAATIIGIAAVMFAFGTLVQGHPADEMFLTVVALTASAIPEGLPAIMTVTLALGVQRMARRNAIVRRLPAVETLGSVTVICSDKTGTLTRNEMTVQRLATADAVFDVSGIGYAPHGEFFLEGRKTEPGRFPVLHLALRAGVLCNEAHLREKEGEWRLVGDPTEGALLAVAMKGGLDPEKEADAWPRLGLIPFDSTHRFMATYHRGPDGQPWIFMKGAPERVMGHCTEQFHEDGPRPLDPDYWESVSHNMAAMGLRVLAIAAKPADVGEGLGFEDVETGMQLLALAGIADPPREEAIRAVRECHSAGIRVKMITGDHALTACVIGRELNIGDGEHSVTGQQIETMSEEELRRVTREVDVFARVSPEHKLRLVAAMQAEGHVVAMTGDGVNDAPALKRADVGVAMGRKGTEVAREAAHMVLTDDNFASIAHAVEEGRTVYDNLRKAIIFILPTNGAETLTVVVAILLGLALPITAVQILWVNLATEITLSLALAFEPPEPGVMKRPPRRPDAPLLTPFFYWRIASVSLLAFAGTLGAFLWTLSPTGNPFFAPQFDAEHLALARTVAVNTLVMLELVYLFNTRFIVGSALSRAGLLGSPYVLGASAAVMGLQLLFTYLPVAQRLFDTRPMSATHWGLVLGVSLAVFFIVEVEKAIVRRLGVRL